MKTRGLAVEVLLAGTCALAATVVSGQECGPCSDCENPIVRLEDIKIRGDLGDLPGSSEFYGWDDAARGDVQSDVFSQYMRGMDFLEAERDHPCADIYYFIEHPDGSLHRAGAEVGEAKYMIKSDIDLVRDTSGEHTVVREIVYRQTALPPSSKDQFHVEELSDELKVVPLKGRIHVEHKLVALKNEEVYDTGTSVIEWVDDPPEPQIPDPLNPGDSWTSAVFFFARDGQVQHGGETYSARDGLITGDFAPGDLAGLRVTFDEGDIGVTIRKKETPSSADIRVDDRTQYPPYYVFHVQDVLNHFQEPLPDNVDVALRVDEGEFGSGKPLQDWMVFRTTGGSIPEPIRYKPPRCNEAKEDTLELAGLCDFHDGDPSVCESPIAEKILNVDCYDVTVTATHEFTRQGSAERVSGPDEWKRAEVDLLMRSRLTAGCTHESTRGSGPVFHEVYRCDSKFSSFSHSMSAVSEAMDGDPDNCPPDVALCCQFWDREWESSTGARFEHAGQPLRLTIYFNRQDGRAIGAFWGLTRVLYTEIGGRQSEMMCSDGRHDTWVDSDSSDERFFFNEAPWALEQPTHEHGQLFPVTMGGGAGGIGGRYERGDSNVSYSLAWEGVEEREVFRWNASRKPE